MHRKITKTLKILVMILFILSLVRNVYAIDPISIVGSGPNYNGVSSLYDLGNVILGIIQYIGAGVAVIATLVLAMRYMYSSPDEKAEIKKKLIPFIIGGVLVFGAVSLVKLVEKYVKDISP